MVVYISVCTCVTCISSTEKWTLMNYEALGGDLSKWNTIGLYSIDLHTIPWHYAFDTWLWSHRNAVISSTHWVPRSWQSFKESLEAASLQRFLEVFLSHGGTPCSSSEWAFPWTIKNPAMGVPPWRAGNLHIFPKESPKKKLHHFDPVIAPRAPRHLRTHSLGKKNKAPEPCNFWVQAIVGMVHRHELDMNWR